VPTGVQNSLFCFAKNPGENKQSPFGRLRQGLAKVLFPAFFFCTKKRKPAPLGVG